MWLYFWKRENESQWNCECFPYLDMLESMLNDKGAKNEEKVFWFHPEDKGTHVQHKIILRRAVGEPVD